MVVSFDEMIWERTAVATNMTFFTLSFKYFFQVDKVYAQPSVLPKLRGCKQVRTKLQNETLQSKVESGKMLQLSKSKRSLCRADSITESVAFDRKFLFDDEISMCLSQFDHSAYAMIPGKLYKYEDTVASSKLKEEPVADLFVPYNVALMYLKVTVIEILFGKNFLEKRQFHKALKKLRIWVFDKKKLKWTHLVTESDWTHAKLVAQEESERLRIMYSLRYIPGASGGSTVAGSSFCSTTVASQDITNASDDYSVLSDEFSGVQLDDEMRLTTASLSRLDCHTPNPPHVSVSGMLMLKNDEAFSTKSSFFEEIPKEQFMANYLESKLMKSRY